MDVNINNYEEIAMDYLEGNLDISTREAMEAFLIDHPVIKEELDGLGDVVMVPESIPYPNKSSLKKAPGRVIIPPAWYKMGIAAAFGGLLSLFAYNFFANKEGTPALEAKETIESETTDPTIENKGLVANYPSEDKETESVSETSVNSSAKQSKPSTQKVTKEVASKRATVVNQTLTAEVKTVVPKDNDKATTNDIKVVKMPEIPSPAYDTEEVLYAAAEPSKTKRAININQFDLNQMLGVTSDYESNNHKILKKSTENDGFEVEDFPSQRTTATSASENSTNTIFQGGEPAGDVSNSLLPKSFGLQITKTKIPKPIKKKRDH